MKYGVGKVEWMPWIRYRDTWVRLSLLWLWVAPIKLSTKPSLSVTYRVYDDSSSECWCILFSMIFLKGCGGRGYIILMSFLMTPRIVFVLDQKKGGLLHHPICRLLGTTGFMSPIESTGFRNGRT